jgi:hypothetical protein
MEGDKKKEKRSLSKVTVSQQYKVNNAMRLKEGPYFGSTHTA